MDHMQSHGHGRRLKMRTIQKIMACVDLSDYSVLTLHYAVALARGFMTDMVILSVVNQRDIDAVKIASQYNPGIINVEQYTKEATEERYRQIYALLKEKFASDMNRMTILVQVGVPFVTILEVAASEKVDVLVLGNKGRGNILGALLGSTAEKVFRHSPVPVLSVRDSARFGRQG